jgi:hypothetical protein
MEYKPLIIKSDFAPYCKMGKNISDSDLDLHIREAQEGEFLSWVPDVFYNDLMDNLSTKPGLTTLFNEYIKPFLCISSYYQFVLWNGANVSQYGTRQNTEDSSQEISDKRRAELMGDILSRKNTRLARLKDKLKDDNYTYDSVVYDFNSDCDKKQLKPQLNIRQLGQSKNYKHRGRYGY